jgi:LCP family protein required for cell wall assembly
VCVEKKNGLPNEWFRDAKSDKSKPSRGSKKPKSLNKRQIAWVFLGAFSYWFAFLLVIALLQLNKIDVERVESEIPKSPGQTWLLIGSDSREDIDDPVLEGAPLGKFEGQRSDTILIMSVPRIGTPLQLTSIPRDLVAVLPAYGQNAEKKNKINAAYAFGGPSLSVNTVEKLVGVQMDNYAEIGFAGLVNVVNSFNGITVCPSRDFSDEKSGLEIKEGCQNVDGLTALAYSRMRYADPKGDIGRTERQQEVVTQIVKKSLSPFTLLNPLRAPQTVSALANAVTVNKGVGPFDLVPLVFALRSGGIDSATLPNKSGGNIGNLGSTRVITEDAKEVFLALQEGTKIPSFETK